MQCERPGVEFCMFNDSYMEVKEPETADSTRDHGRAHSSWSTIPSVCVAALSTLAVGYALGYPSAALVELAELSEGRAFELSGRDSDLFAVSGIMEFVQCNNVYVTYTCICAYNTCMCVLNIVYV